MLEINLPHADPTVADSSELAQLKQKIATLEQENQQLKAQQAERELQHLYSLFEQVPAIVSIQRGPHHIYGLLNSMARQLLGGRDVKGLTMREALPEVESQGFLALLDRVYQTGEPYVGTEILLKLNQSDGTERKGYFNVTYQPWFEATTESSDDDDGNSSSSSRKTIAGVMSFGVEVTDQVKAHAIIRESAARFRQLADNIPAVVWQAETNGDIKFFNRYWLNYTGLTFEDTQNWGWEQVIHPEDIVENVRVWRQSIETGQPFEFEHRFRRYDGVYRWHLGRAEAMRDATGHIEMWIGTNVDIDEQKKAMEQKDQFLAVASHDLRTPLSSIKGYAQILARNLAKEQPGQPETDAAQLSSATKSLNMVRTIIQQSERMNELINRLLDFSRIQGGQLSLQYSENSNLVELLQQVVTQLIVTTENHVLQIDTATPSAVRVSYDAARVEQVLNNLISNAIKYSPDGTTVTVGVEIATAAVSDSQQADETEARDEVVVWVRDEGYGISPEAQAHIFERFYRVQNEQTASKSGLGLGLFISCEIVRQHGGRMWVESEEGRVGSTFYFTLPATSISRGAKGTAKTKA